MSRKNQVVDYLQAIWVVDSDRWYSNLRWQFASWLPHVPHQRIRPATLFESPNRLFQLANDAKTPLVVIFEVDQTSLPTICSLMLRFERNLPEALFLAVGDGELETCKTVMRFTGIAEFYSQEADLGRMLLKVRRFQSSIETSKSGSRDETDADKSLSGLVKQIKHPLRFIFDQYGT